MLQLQASTGVVRQFSRSYVRVWGENGLEKGTVVYIIKSDLHV